MLGFYASNDGKADLDSFKYLASEAKKHEKNTVRFIKTIAKESANADTRP